VYNRQTLPVAESGALDHAASRERDVRAAGLAAARDQPGRGVWERSMPIVGMTGPGGAGRSSAATALKLLGYEPASFGDRLRHLISNSTGLPEVEMTERCDQDFSKPIKLQAFHIDGMCRIAASWATIPNDAPKKMREKAARANLETPRQMMEYVRHDLFEACVADDFWVELFKAHYKPEKDHNLVIDDVDTAVEQEFVRQMQGILIGIERPGVDGAVDGCDLVIRNDGTLEQLQDRVVALLFGHYRGSPMLLSDAPPPPTPKVDHTAQLEAERLRRQVDDLTVRLRDEQRGRADDLKGLQAERDQLARSLTKAQEQLSGAGRAPRAGAAPAAAQPAAPPAAAMDAHASELETAALAARLALALGLEAGLGRDTDGQTILCIDLPAGRLGWPIEEGELPGLPRFDKAATLLDADTHRAVLRDPQVKRAVSTQQALDREHSELATLGGVLHDLVLLAEGCKIHRAYRAKQPPKSDCPTCWAMSDATQRLQKLGALYAERDS